ncbi:MAG: N-acetylglucosamine-6-phosphate deacetylase [Terriglobia bacterium]
MQITANIAGRGLAEIEIQDETINAVRIVGPTEQDSPFVSSGFVDIQVNGFAGIDFSSPDLSAEEAVKILPPIWETGVTTFCPTLITNSVGQLERNFRVVEEARRLDASFAATVPCYHLEGPYLSPGESHGAHNPALMHAPDWDEFSRLQTAAGGRIAIVTLAPELPGACDFISRLRAAGVIAAIGHTDGTAENIHSASEAGAALSTHLGNGCPSLIHRHQNPIWAQLASERLSASLICDGFHLPRDLVRAIYRAKGSDRCILITDAVHAATLSPGRYSLAGTEIELLPTGQVVTADRRSMAGSALSMNRAVRTFEEFAGASLRDALDAASTNPGRLLHREGICVKLSAGEPANLVVFHPEAAALRVEAVFLRGRRVVEA